MERALYNGINAGMSLSGNMYCYRNPLASAGEKIRNPWYGTLCCPPNLQRTFMSLGGYFYSTSKDDGLWLHFYDNHQLDWRLSSGAPIKAEMKTGMPWQGDVRLTLAPQAAIAMTLNLRIPEWSPQTKVAINGVPFAGKVEPNTYLAIKRTWKPGDVVTLAFDMTPKRIAANPRVPETYGKVSIQRGPFLYCLEQPDLDGASVFDISLSAGAPLAPVRRQDKFAGEITVLEGRGLASPKPGSEAPLYAYGQPVPPSKPVPLTLIPYYTFNNRGDSAFAVWLPRL
jgi:DUF1680 family protein